MNFITIFSVLITASFFLQSCSPSPIVEHSDAIVLSLEEKDKINANYNIFLDRKKEMIDTNVFTSILDSSYYLSPKKVLLQLQQFYNYKLTTKTKLLTKQYQPICGSSTFLHLLSAYTPSSKQLDSSCRYPSPITYFIFDSNGYLITKKKALKATFVTTMKDSLALLMTIEADCEGVGRHHLYQYDGNRWIDILNNLLPEKQLISYDANPSEKGMFLRNKMTASFYDINEDGHQDFILIGTWLVLENAKGKKYSPAYPFKKEKVVYTFIYKPAKESFYLEEL